MRFLLVAAMLSVPAAHAVSAPSPAPVPAAATAGPGAAQLQAQYTQLRPSLERNAFGRAIHIQSSEAGRNQAGEVYAVVDHPFEVVERGLRDAQSWCDVLILPYNTKHCHASGSGAATRLAVRIGRKADQAPEDAQPITFRYALQAESADYFRVTLEAPEGPLSTRDYRILLEATPLDAQRTIIHLGYSYGFGTMARLAMQAYLATAGAHKVGFTVVGRDSDGKPRYVGGMRGVIERNTMRYYLAIDAYLDSPAEAELPKRLAQWFDSTERYARQLHEVDRNDYLEMKRNEYKRLKTQ